MLSLDAYIDKPQTYVKHFFLERYISRVALNVYSWSGDFVYIDGFTGPWLSKHEKCEDTSFAIALEQLKKAKNASYRVKKKRALKCFFVERDAAAYEELQKFLSSVKGVDCKPINGNFESAINQIVDYVGTQFSFCFIDPKGFTGFGMDAIRPILNLRGEVLINFMYTYVNKHLGNSDDVTRKQMDDLFGGGDWREEIDQKIADGVPREEAIMETYCSQLKVNGNFPYVTSTRVMFGTKDRTYYYLVYGTRHRKGLEEFRAVEAKTAPEQEKIRTIMKYQDREKRTGIKDLFSDIAAPIETKYRSFDELRSGNLEKAKKLLLEIISTGTVDFYDCLEVLEIPYVWKSDIKEMLLSLRDEKKIQLEFEKPRQYRPQKGTKIRMIRN